MNGARNIVKGNLGGKMNLINVLKEINNQISSTSKEYNTKAKELENTYKKKIEELQVAYKVNMEMNTACLNCEGTGKETYADDDCYDSRLHHRTCSVCNGTGIKKDK